MNVLMISPGFPVEQPFFTRALANIGNRVIGIGDQPHQELPAIARAAMSAYFQVPLGDSEKTLAIVTDLARRCIIDSVQCTWEPYMILASRIREMLGLPGMTVGQTIPFRDKEVMKQILDQNGIRTPHHYRCHNRDQIENAIERIGYPICIKPIAGAGSADTYRVDDQQQLTTILPRLGHLSEVSVEEFIEAEEYTFDTVCIDGQIKFFNICQYRPRPLIGRTNQWISQQTIALRNVEHEYYHSGVNMGRRVLQALGFRTGFTHMEWYRKADGEAVFGEIACRPPGANTVDLMNFANDFDIYTGWAEAVTGRPFAQTVSRKYHAGHIFKRSSGDGHIQRIEGLDELLKDYQNEIVLVDLLPIGSRRRDWKQTLRSDGMLIVRHPELDRTLEVLDQIGMRLQMYAT